MKALVKARAEPGIWLQDVAVPEPSDNEVLIKIRKTAICGTDLHIYNWDDWAQRTIPVPMVIGHEFCGEIVALGNGAEKFKTGQRVSGEGHIVCGICRNCRAGRGHLCRRTIGVGVDRPGAFAEYLCIPERNVYPLPDELSDDIAAILDPFGNAVHTALSFDLIAEDVLITGAGSIGIMAALVARAVGARKVVITDINPDRLAMARSAGIDTVVDASCENLDKVMASIGMTEGFDVGLEMSGAPEALRSMIRVMNNGGRIAILGLAPTAFDIDWNEVIFKMLTIKGIYGREIFETWYKMTSLARSKVDLEPLITHRLEVDDYLEGFSVMAAGRSGKVILDWSLS